MCNILSNVKIIVNINNDSLGVKKSDTTENKKPTEPQSHSMGFPVNYIAYIILTQPNY